MHANVRTTRFVVSALARKIEFDGGDDETIPVALD